MVQPTKLFWKAATHVLRYLRGTSQFGLWYKWTEWVKLQGFTDADWARNPSNQKSTYGGIFNLGSAGVSWYSRKQRSVAHSSAEAEHMAASQAACEVIWMRKILVGLFGQRMDPTAITVIIRVASNSLRIHFFMTGPSTLISGITIFKIVWSRGSCYCCMFPPRNKMQIFWQRHCQDASSSSTDTGLGLLIIPFLLRGNVENSNKKC